MTKSDKMRDSQQNLGFEDGLRRLRAGLHDFGRFRKRWARLDGVAKFVLATPGALLLWAALDWAVELPAWPLLLLFLAVCGLGVWASVRWLLKPQLLRVNAEREALVIESLHGALDNQLIGSLQLGGEIEKGGLAYSPDLIKTLVANTAAGLPGIGARGLVDLSRTKRFLVSALSVLLLLAAALVFARAAIRQRYLRLGEAYKVVMDTLFPVTMKVRPGDWPVVRGHSVTLGVDVLGARRREVRLVRCDDETKETVTKSLKIADESAGDVMEDVQSPFTYYFEYGGRLSSKHRILVDDLPEIKAINYELTPPPYTGQSMQLMTGRLKKLQGLVGTTVFVSFAASTKLHSEFCYVEWQNGDRNRIEVSGRFGSFAFGIRKPDRLAIYLAHPFAGRSDEFRCKQPSRTIEIAVKRDQPPTVQMLIRKQTDLAMTPARANAIRIPWLATDDFGVAEVTLDYEVDTINELLGRGKRKGTLPHPVDPPRDRVKGRFEKIFRNVQPPLAPGDQIRISLAAKDNNTEPGPAVRRSDEIEILVVGSDFGMFTEGELSLGGRRESALALLQAHRVKRATDLLQEPVKTVRTEKPVDFKKYVLKANPDQKTMLSEAEDDVGRYFELLSGSDR